MANPPGLFEVAREKMRVRHLAFRTEQAYLQRIRRYVDFHQRQQARQALLFLYRNVLGITLPWLDNVTWANRPKRLPVVLTRAEVRSVLGAPRLVNQLRERVRPRCSFRL